MTPTLERISEPRYSLSEVARLASVHPQSARRWLTGYGYTYGGERRVHPPVGHEDEPGAPGASFLDLVELVAIGRLKEVGFSLRAIRAIANNCRDIFGVERPLASLQFKTDGGEIFIGSSGALIEVGRRKREQAWSEVLRPHLETLEYDDHFALAIRWWPLGKSAPVVVDPEFGFGLPVITGSGVRTEIVLERFTAGDLPDQIADDFGVAEESVERALQFEVARATA